MVDTSLIIVAVYLLTVLGIGYYFKDKRSGDDYWRAGGQIGTFINVMAVFAAVASGGALVGAVGISYQFGAALMYAFTAGTIFGMAAGSVLVAEPLRQLDAYTPTDIFNSIYGNKWINLFVPIITIIGITPYVIAQLKAAGVVTQFLLGVEYAPAVIVAGLVFIVYVALGGMWAVTVTDFLQGSMMWVVGVILAIYSILHFGSITGPVVMPRITGMAPLPIQSYIGFFIVGITSIMVFPHVLMRIFSSKNAESAKRTMSWMALVFSTFVFLTFVIVAAAAVSLNPDLNNADLAMLVVLNELVPNLIAGFAAAAILAAIMSTTDALLLAISALITNDIYGSVVNPNASDRSIVRLSVITTSIVGLIAIFIAAFDPPDLLVQLFVDGLGLIAASLTFPLLLGIWWKRANQWGALAGILVGAILYPIFWTMLPPYSSILVSLPASMVATIGVTLFTSPPSTDEIERRTEELQHNTEL
jgi:sodium/pantothenate symporter